MNTGQDHFSIPKSANDYSPVKIIKSAVLFLFSFIFIYYLFLFIGVNVRLGNTPVIYRLSKGMVRKGGFTYERFRKYNRHKKYDIIVLGSSRANRGINPAPFRNHGYELYNLGTDDQTPLNSNIITHRYINRENCRLVIIDAFDKVFCQNPLESNSDLIQNLDSDKSALEMAVASSDIRCFNLFNVRLLLKSHAPDYKANRKMDNGYSGASGFNKISSRPYRYVTDHKQLNSFGQLLKYLKSQNIPCLIVSQPVRDDIHKEDHKQFLADVLPIIRKYNFEFHDFSDRNDLISFNEFYDNEHLNLKGADIYSEFLAETYIQKIITPVSSLKNLPPEETDLKHNDNY